MRISVIGVDVNCLSIELCLGIATTEVIQVKGYFDSL